MSKTSTTRRTRQGRKRIDENAHGMTPELWAQLRSKANTQVLAEARGDPDALPIEDRRAGSLGPPGRSSTVKRIRWKLGLSQSEFSAAFGIPLGTLRDWEQRRRKPDQAARSYLEVIARDPGAVRRALSKVPA